MSCFFNFSVFRSDDVKVTTYLNKPYISLKENSEVLILSCHSVFLKVILNNKNKTKIIEKTI